MTYSKILLLFYLVFDDAAVLFFDYFGDAFSPDTFLSASNFVKMDVTDRFIGLF